MDPLCLGRKITTIIICAVVLGVSQLVLQLTRAQRREKWIDRNEETVWKSSTLAAEFSTLGLAILTMIGIIYKKVEENLPIEETEYRRELKAIRDKDKELKKKVQDLVKEYDENIAKARRAVKSGIGNDAKSAKTGLKEKGDKMDDIDKDLRDLEFTTKAEAKEAEAKDKAAGIIQRRVRAKAAAKRATREAKFKKILEDNKNVFMEVVNDNDKLEKTFEKFGITDDNIKSKLKILLLSKLEKE